MGAIDAVSMEARQALLEVMMVVAWADREIAPEERQAGQAAAMALGLVLPGEKDVAASTEPVRDLDALDFSRLTPRDRELVYVCAEWMAFADSLRKEEESALLGRLRAKLGVGPEQAEALHASAAVLHERHTVEGGSVWRAFDRLVVEAARMLAKRG